MGVDCVGRSGSYHEFLHGSYTGLLWIADALKAAMRQARKIPLLFVEAAAVVGTVLFVMWATGYFMIPVKSGETNEFGRFATNLLGPIDSWGGAMFLMNLPKSPYRLGEGYCYVRGHTHDHLHRIL